MNKKTASIWLPSSKWNMKQSVCGNPFSWIEHDELTIASCYLSPHFGAAFAYFEVQTLCDASDQCLYFEASSWQHFIFLFFIMFLIETSSISVSRGFDLLKERSIFHVDHHLLFFLYTEFRKEFVIQHLCRYFRK